MVAKMSKQVLEVERLPVSETTRVLIVDSQPFFSELLHRSLTAEPGIEVVAVVHDGETAVQVAKETAPDVVLMDTELDGSPDGIEAGLRIKQENLQTSIVFLSSDDRHSSGLIFKGSPVWSCLMKQRLPDIATLVYAIQCSSRGMVIQDPIVMAESRLGQNSVLAGLTSRQQEVLQFVAQGYSNAALAEQLTLTEKTIETYISAIYQHLNLSGEREINARVKAALLYLEDYQSR